MRAFLFPGQGSQRRGMGAELFDSFAEHWRAADAILGYSVRDVCANGDARQLQQTQYTQPMLFVVNAIKYLARRQEGIAPQIVAGHSLGEYNALFAADCFDFETGVRLVRKRGELMGRAVSGGMMAVLGVEAGALPDLLGRAGAADVDIANYNGAAEIVLSGPQASLRAVSETIGRSGQGRCIPLTVSAPFHSRYMAEAATAFDDFLRGVTFRNPALPVLSNVTGRPHEAAAVASLLVEQIRSPVRWADCMRYLIEQGVDAIEEVGSGQTLSKLWQSESQREPPPRAAPAAALKRNGVPYDCRQADGLRDERGAIRIAPEQLGCRGFCRDYRLRYAYLAGAMYKGIASSELVVRMGRAGLIGFFGSGGLRVAEIDQAIGAIQRELGRDGNYGMNLLHALDDAALEQATVSLFLERGVRNVEAAAYLRMTPSLVRFRFKGAHRDPSGRPVVAQRVLAKVSRPEIAALFMRPPPESILRELVQQGALTAPEAEVAQHMPVSEEVCAEADSGGHTDARNVCTLLPAVRDLRDQMMRQFNYAKRIRVGASGGIGTPEAAAAAFVLGADFVVTGSINQCSPEAGTSSEVKDMLAGLDIQDTAYAPAGDMFELGARVQVVKAGTLFSARANKLYQIYRRHASLDEIDGDSRRAIEETYFKQSIEEVWRETAAYLSRERPGDIERAERNPKFKMALVFKWYFIHSARLAQQGVAGGKVNYQIHCGPAMGAFNRFVKGTELEDWRNRHVDVIAERLMQATAQILVERLAAFVPVPVQQPTASRRAVP